MLIVHLMRHFQTPCSAAGRYCGNCQTGLTATGEEMAAALAAQRAAVAYDALYCSPLPRAHASLGPLGAARGQFVTALPGMQEIDYGAWENMTAAAARARDPGAFAAWEAAPVTVAPPGGETAAAVAARAVAAMATVAARHPSGQVLVASHKATLRLLLCAWLHVPLAEFRQRLAQPWGAISSVRLGPDGAQLLGFGDRAYLPPHLQGLD